MRVTIFCLLLSAIFGYSEENSQKAFPHKLIFSDTPEIGRKWRGGVRVKDFIIWDFNINVHNWFLVDYFRAGFNEFKTDEGGEITDKFSLFTIKSAPYTKKIKQGDYKVGGGFKVFNAEFNISEIESGEGAKIYDDKSFLLFITQGYTRNKNYFNLFSSLSFRDKYLLDDSKKTSTTYYLIPGYQFRLSDNFNLAAEYYMTNTEHLPIKIVQFLLDEDAVDFWNPDRKLVTYLMWGVSYTRRHLRIDLHIANHNSFVPPYIPLIGIGWHF